MSNELQVIDRQLYKGERPLFQAKDLLITDTVFDEGESPLKHSENITLKHSLFKWKYPLWYSKNISVWECTFYEMARAGIWYTNDISIEKTLIEAPKQFRRCTGLSIRDVSIPNAAETLWECKKVTLNKVTVNGDYFGMNCEDIYADDLVIHGNYCFDGTKNVEVHNCRFMSKDCFWNSENITIYDSYISGEYLAWNSKNVTLINCTVESLQGMCYIDNLVMKNCRLINTTLAFEYSTVDVEIVGKVDSIINPTSGTIRADEIGELILEEDKIDVSKVKVIVKGQSK